MRSNRQRRRDFHLIFVSIHRCDRFFEFTVNETGNGRNTETYFTYWYVGETTVSQSFSSLCAVSGDRRPPKRTSFGEEKSTLCPERKIRDEQRKKRAVLHQLWKTFPISQGCCLFCLRSSSMRGLLRNTYADASGTKKGLFFPNVRQDIGS